MCKFSIVAKKDHKSEAAENKIKDGLLKNGWHYDKENPDIVICVGGDGTLLYGVHKYLPQLDHISFLGIHTGTLGFFTDYTEDEIDTCIRDMLHKNPHIFASCLLQIDIYREDMQRVYALNEMRIENIIRTQQTDVYVDGEFFETCRGSGICLCTQAGSSAYNRSLGGAVIDSGLSLMQLSEITAIQHRKHRSLGNPYILMENRQVTFQSEDFSDALLGYDHLHIDLKDVKKICCTMSDKRVRFARYREYSYLKRLKTLY